MTSWRDDVSKTVLGEMDGLLDTALRSAKDRLDADDVLVPFVQVVEDDGTESARLVEIVEDVRPDQLLEELFEKLRAERDQVRCVAVVFDAIVGGARAVQVLLEHRSPKTPALVLAVPYKAQKRRHQLGEVRAAEGERRIWP
ncbi:hypothetical protein NOK12_18740 [Nocardioides sp. OK12]|uniref:Uncharacterized protein n=1 Tax=Nocardioides marinisabuli TaxID=419476 RepID=A0A7Y9JRB2_9ACTN|nr:MULTISPECIES: hypothetical protein [Nocardioides]NYD56604.1 hypothetical protein [Nocardioides marinisabuli]GHJ59356.1 hypothetical protein NOK12_18740 [Nocardioides sp. OK12]